MDEELKTFKEGDVVWVKLDSYWWPGEVKDKDNVPDEAYHHLKKEPVAIVKFFDEDYYEFVKVAENIYPYNCRKKNDFIKKGMDGFRAKNPRWTKFPKDVGTAEDRTGGNPDIFSDPIFSPGKRRNYTAEIFGSPKPKKAKEGSGKGRPSKIQLQITHRRFLGCDDFKSYIVIQDTPLEQPLDEDNEDSVWFGYETKSNNYTCPECKYVTTRLGVLTAHRAFHASDGVSGFSGKPFKKSQTKRKHTIKSKKRKSSKLNTDDSVSSENIIVKPSAKNKSDTSLQSQKNACKGPEELHAEQQVNVRTDLLAEWDDDDEDITDISQVNESLTKPDSPQNLIDAEVSSPNKNDVNLNKKSDKNKSCFDFEEEEEPTIVSATLGRKIPRLIPSTEKRKSFHSDDDENDSDEKKKEKSILDESTDLTEKEFSENIKELDELDKAYKELMDSTSKIELPEIPNTLKSEQNFHCVKTIKFPDKSPITELDISLPEDSNTGQLKLTEHSDSELLEQSAECIDVATESEELLNNSITAQVSESTAVNTTLLQHSNKVSEAPTTDFDKNTELQPAGNEEVNSEIETVEDINHGLTTEVNKEVGNKITHERKRRKNSETSKSEFSYYPKKSRRSRIRKKDKPLDVSSGSGETVQKHAIEDLFEVETTEEKGLNASSQTVVVLSAKAHAKEEKTVTSDAELDKNRKQSIVEEKELQASLEIATLNRKEEIKTISELALDNIEKHEQTIEEDLKDSSQIVPILNERESVKVASETDLVKNEILGLEALNKRQVDVLSEAELNKNEKFGLEPSSSIVLPLLENEEIKITSDLEVDPNDKYETTQQESLEESSLTETVLNEKELNIIYKSEIDKNVNHEASEEKELKKSFPTVSSLNEKKEVETTSELELDDNQKLQTIKDKDSEGSHSIVTASNEKEEYIIASETELEINDEHVDVREKGSEGTSSKGASWNEKEVTLITSESELDQNMKHKTTGGNSLEGVSSTVTKSATKLTSPKKRFVKSFEDFELQLHEQRRSAEAEDMAKKLLSQESISKSVNKKTEMSESSTSSGLPVYKLKTQLMSKIGNDNLRDSNSLEKLKEKSSTANSVLEDVKVSETVVDKDLSHSENYEHLLSSTIENSENTYLVTDVEMGLDVPNTSKDSEQMVTLEPIANVLRTMKEPNNITYESVDLEKTSDFSNVSDSSRNIPDFVTPLIRKSPKGLQIADDTNETLNVLFSKDSKIGSGSDPLNKIAELSSKDSNNEVHFKYIEDGNQSEFDIAIQTNLSNLNSPSIGFVEKSEQNTIQDKSNTSIFSPAYGGFGNRDFDAADKMLPESELVAIDGNLTVVSEKDLADGQVEITTSNKKPVTLMSFSMDFFDESNEEINTEKVNKAQHVPKTSANNDQTISILSKVADQNERKYGIINDSLVQDKKDKTDKRETTSHQLNEIKSFDTISQVDKKQTLIASEILKPLSGSQNKSNDKVGNSEASRKAHLVDTKKQVREFIDVESTEGEKSDATLGKTIKIDVKTPHESLMYTISQGSSSVIDMFDLEDHIPSQIVYAKEHGHKKLHETIQLSTDAPTRVVQESGSKLLSRLTAGKRKGQIKMAVPSALTEVRNEEPLHRTNVIKSKDLMMRNTKAVKAVVRNRNIAQMNLTSKKSSKAIILSEKIHKHAPASTTPISFPSKKFSDNFQLEPHSTLKNAKRVVESSKSIIKPIGKQTFQAVISASSTSPKVSGKAKILNQTIITPSGEIYHPKVSPPVTSTNITTSNNDDNMFDINSMPIVLSDELLTPESLEKMPIVLSDTIPSTSSYSTIPTATETKVTKKPAFPNPVKLLNKPYNPPNAVFSELRNPLSKFIKTQVVQTTTPSAQKIIKHVSSTLTSSKSGKYIIVPQKTRPNIVRKTLPASITPRTQNIGSEASGNKIMIVTNEQGQQHRVLLTPAQQKMFGVQETKATKTTFIKSTVPRTTVVKTLTAGSSFTNVISNQVSNSNQIMQSITRHVSPSPIKPLPGKRMQKVVNIVTQSPSPKSYAPTRTILVKNQHGQTVRKVHKTDDTLLDIQVAQQLEAIKASNLKLQQNAEVFSYRPSKALVTKRQYSKKVSSNATTMNTNVVNTTQSKTHMVLQSPSASTSKPEANIPPLAPITDKKTEEVPRTPSQPKKSTQKEPVQRPLNQMVLQDSMGQQTIVTEGQIIALPTETVDGQPQSYMLVTLDESGNLIPLDNETLMTLDPNLDLSKMVLQIEQPEGTPATEPEKPATSIVSTGPPAVVPELISTVQTAAALDTEVVKASEKCGLSDFKPSPPQDTVPMSAAKISDQNLHSPVVSPVSAPNVPSETPGQQLILTGDPITAQKILDSLAEGGTDLANLLANAEGGSFVIQADGQQILINTEPADNQLLLTINPDLNTTDTNERTSNPMFATPTNKSQDILAAALADTDVFQPEHTVIDHKILHSQLSPSGTLFPVNVGNVLETSLTLNSPIMTPLEVPSTNTKKIPDEEADILTRVPKNLDLPITITDPNISQTVAQHHVASLLSNDLTSLELSLPISDAPISASSIEMSSPSFSYSLPISSVVAESADNISKSFSSSMPLLTEETDEHLIKTTVDEIDKKETQESESVSQICKSKNKSEEIQFSIGGKLLRFSTYDDSDSEVDGKSDDLLNEGLRTLGGEMCSSLSEPPPEMFEYEMPDRSDVEANFHSSEDKVTSDKPTENIPSPIITNEDSLEIPVQPQIVTDLNKTTISDN